MGGFVTTKRPTTEKFCYFLLCLKVLSARLSCINLDSLQISKFVHFNQNHSEILTNFAENLLCF